MLAKKDDQWWEESKKFKKTVKEEYLDIDETLIEIEKNSPIIRYELNVIELPLFSKDTKRTKNQIKVYHFKTDKSSFLEVEPPANSSIPGEFEERLFITLTKIMKKNNYSRRIVVSANEILENMGLSNKVYYKRIKNSLTLLSKTNYTFMNSLYSNKESGIIDKKVVSSIMSISIISKRDPKSKEIEQFEDGRIKEVYEISFSDYFYDNIIRRGYLAIDSEKLLSIENAIARSIFTILEKWRGYDLYIKRQAFFIARRIPLRWDKTQIKRTINSMEKALIVLKERNLLKEYRIIKNSKWELAEIEVFYDEVHNKTKRDTFFTEKNEFSTLDMFVTSTEEKVKSISENASGISEILNLFPEKVLSMKTFESFIINAVEKYGFNYVKRTSEYTILKRPTSYKSYLVKALDENWAEEYIANKEATKKKEEKIQEAAPIIEEANIVETYKYTWEEFLALSINQQEEITLIAYEKYLKDTGSQDSKLIRGIFEKGKKTYVLKVMETYISEEQELKEESENNIEKNKCENEIVGLYVSVTEFMLKVREIMRVENLNLNFKDLVEVFKLFGEYEDKFIKIMYDEVSQKGTIIVKK